MHFPWLFPLSSQREPRRRASSASSLVLVGVTLGVGCGADGDGAPAYQARVEAARIRVTEAACACLWTIGLRAQCEEVGVHAFEAECADESAALLAREHPQYAECVADASERQARCYEEAGCSGKSAKCVLDTYVECGPAPTDLSDEVASCLPHFRCGTGQEVSLSRRCDGTDDCFDRSDERDCP